VADGKACVTSTKEVILFANTMQPPQILGLAGIDGQNLFESHGVPFRIDNPSGSKNFEDHLILPIDFEVDDGGVALKALRNRKILEQAFGDYAASRTDPLVGMFPSSALCSPPQIQSSKQTLSNTRVDALFSRLAPDSHL
jgi:choline dehydrogenase-like flavoprotein